MRCPNASFLCIAVLHFAAAAAAPLLPPPGCPEDHWAVKHAAWQATADASAPRLTWITTNKSPGGWGDRVRGSLLALRIAAANNRTLYLRWGGLHVLDAYLQPATFDWRPPPQSCTLPGDKCDIESGVELVLDRETGKTAGLSVEFDGELAAALASGRDIVMDQRRAADSTLPLSGAAPGGQLDLACAWAVLYAPTAELTARGEAELEALNITRPYAAVHLRLGGLEGERHALARVKDVPRATSCPLTLARVVTSCAAALRTVADTSSSSSSPTDADSVGHGTVLVITDNEALRAQLASGSVDGAVGPDYTAAHVSLAAYARKRAGTLWDAWVDVYLLANADQLLTSRSGFSDVAAWWGTPRVTAHVAACVRADVDFEAACKRERKRGSR